MPVDKRAEVTRIAPDFYRVTLRYGFMQDASIPEGLSCAVGAGLLPEAFTRDLTVFVGHETVLPKADGRGMSSWREG
ncbi:KUP/HAK/KT family potassium transporter, partial [Vibrio parahaemolyticus]